MATAPSIGPTGATATVALPAADVTRDLYERFGRQIFTYCYMQLGNREDAEDAVQNTFLNAFRGLGRGVELEFESAWLYKIAENVCLTKRRAWSRRRRVERPEDLDAIQDVIGAPPKDAEELMGLRNALKSLPEQQRQAILPREWQGLSYKEIAEELDISQAAVETLIFRARRNLAEALEKVRALGEFGIGSLLKSLLTTGGVKIAATVATVATTTVVASAPPVRDTVVHFAQQAADVVVSAPTTSAAKKLALTSVTTTAPASVASTQPASEVAPPPQKLTPRDERRSAGAASTPALAALTTSVPTPVTTVASETTVPATTPPGAAAVSSTTPTVTTASGGGDDGSSRSSGGSTTQTSTTSATSTPSSSSGKSDSGSSRNTSSVSIPPAIGGLTPSSGSVGTTVVISGSYFSGATAVSFNGQSAPFRVDNDGQITTRVPDGTTSGNIVVTTSAGTANGGTFTVTVPGASISGFSPQSGTPGTTVTLYGSRVGSATAVRFNGTSAAFTQTGDNVVQAKVPDGATSGPITITTPGGTVSATANFTVLVAASVSGISPASGTAGTTVTISGAHLSGVTTVRFNGTSATFTVVSDSQITVTVPAYATTGQVVVTTSVGSTNAGAFTVLVAPTLYGFTPSSGAPGTTVQIGGAHLGNATSVKFNGVSATFTQVSESQVSAIVPAAATSGQVSVTTAAGTATTSNSFTVILSPAVSGLSPNAGPAGTTVVITGTHLTGATSVRFGDASASFSVTSDSQITATVPNNASTNLVRVSTPSGTAYSSSSFTVTAATPTISGLSPGSAAVGSAIAISGTHLNGASSVRFSRQ